MSVLRKLGFYISYRTGSICGLSLSPFSCYSMSEPHWIYFDLQNNETECSKVGEYLRNCIVLYWGNWTEIWNAHWDSLKRLNMQPRFWTEPAHTLDNLSRLIWFDLLKRRYWDCVKCCSVFPCRPVNVTKRGALIFFSDIKKRDE